MPFLLAPHLNVFLHFGHEKLSMLVCFRLCAHHVPDIHVSVVAVSTFYQVASMFFQVSI